MRSIKEMDKRLDEREQEIEQLKDKIDQIKDIYTSMQFSAPENYYLWLDKLGKILEGKENE